MSQKIARLLAPRFGLYFLVMALFAGISALLGRSDVALAELIVVALMFAVYYATVLRRKKATTAYLEELMDSLDTAAKSSMLNCPLPMVMFCPETDEIIWTNDRFLRLREGQAFSEQRNGTVLLTRETELPADFAEHYVDGGKQADPQLAFVDETTGTAYFALRTGFGGSGREAAANAALGAAAVANQQAEQLAAYTPQRRSFGMLLAAS